MTFEVRVEYTNGFGTVAKIDRERSVKARSITEEEAQTYMCLFESMGARRHETNTQIFYDMIEDSNHNTEYIFHK